MDVQANLMEDEGGGYLVAVSDMMAALLFVFMITLVAFVINFQLAAAEQEEAQQEAVAEKERAEAQRDLARAAQQRLESVRDDLTNARRLREEMLEAIRAELEERGIRVEIDSEHGILRLTENAISFGSAQATLAQREREKLNEVATVLAEVIPCYAEDAPTSCETRTQGKLEAVFIEGHTDNVPLQGGRFRDNWDLSAQRAMYTYRSISSDQPELIALRNALDQPLFSVSGYGAGRPIINHDEPTAEPRNRRIDLRFIMAPPTAIADPEPIRALREQGVR